MERYSVRKQIGLGLAGGLLQHVIARRLPRLNARLAASDRRSRERSLWRTLLRTVAVRMALEAWMSTGDRAMVRAQREGWTEELAPETVFLYLVTAKDLQELHEKAVRGRPRREWMPLLDARRRDAFTDEDGDFWALNAYFWERGEANQPREFDALVDDLDEHLGGDWRLMSTDTDTASALREDAFDLDHWRSFFDGEGDDERPQSAATPGLLGRLRHLVSTAGPGELLLIRSSE